MAYNKTITVTKNTTDAVIPENAEWITYRDGLISQGKITKWNMSDFNSDGEATIEVVMDSEGTWNDICAASNSIRVKTDFTVTS
jgi:hypothetical protein